jgi:hypothetical protein
MAGCGSKCKRELRTGVRIIFAKCGCKAVRLFGLAWAAWPWEDPVGGAKGVAFNRTKSESLVGSRRLRCSVTIRGISKRFLEVL